MKKKSRLLAVILAVLMLLSAMSLTASAAERSTYEVYEVEVTSEYYGFVQFVPERSGWYEFYTNDDYYDTSATLCDKNNVDLAYDDDSGYELNFLIKAYLEAGEVYYLFVDCYDSNYEDVYLNVYVEDTVAAVDATITQMPYNTTVYRDAEYYSLNLDGLEIEFMLSDGTRVDWSYEYYNAVAGTDVYFDFYYDENDEIYVDGNTVYVLVECDDAYAFVALDYKESPVDYIDADIDSLTFTEYTDGYYDEEYGMYVYDFYDKLEGTEVTIYYKDGTNETVIMDSYTDDGYTIYAYSSQFEEGPWVPGGDNFIYIHYLDAYAAIPVKIQSSKVKSVEVTEDPDKTVYEGRYYPLWDGAEFTVTLTDGTTESVTVNKNNISYGIDPEGTLMYIVDVNGYEVEITYNYDDSIGEYYGLYCQGAYDYYYGFEFVDSKDVKDITIKNFNPDMDSPMSYVVTFTDGTKKTFNTADSVFVGWGMDYTEAYIKSPYGIAWGDVNVDEYDDYGDASRYLCWFHGEEFYMYPEDIVEPEGDGLLGDANEDGKINVKDATTVQKHTAAMITLSDYAKVLADVDGNGKVNVKDATAIQKYVAAIDTGFDIGEPVFN